MPGRGELPPALARWRADALIVAASLLPLALFAAREWHIAGAPGFPLDDSWIHLHFARNLASGAGFSYNPGIPVAGSTAPLWTLLLGAGAAVSSASLAMAKIVGILATLGAALVTRRAAVAWGARGDVALAASIALSWMGPIAWGALSGMEVSLAALLVAGALLAHARDRELATAACVALAVLARPEALLLVPFFVASRPLTVRRVSVFAVVTLVVVAPAVLFSLWTAGTPYPATAAAKVEGGLVGWLGGVREPAALTWIRRPLAYLDGMDRLARHDPLAPADRARPSARPGVAPRGPRPRPRSRSCSSLTRSAWRYSPRTAAPPSRRDATRSTSCRSRCSSSQ